MDVAGLCAPFRLEALEYVSSKASGDHGSKGGSGVSVSLESPIPSKDDITSSIAFLRGEGVRPVAPGEGGQGLVARGV